METNGDKSQMNDENVVQLGRETSASRIKNIRSMAQVRTFAEEELQKRKIVYAGMPDKKLLNIYRDIRTKLIRKSSGKNFVLLVSSVCDGGGASFNALNIAAAFSLDEAKTSMLLDCNLHRSSFADLVGMEVEAGLTDYLVNDEIDAEDVIYASGVPRVRVVPAGTYTESGAEYFSSVRMTQFIDSIKSRYPDRFIVIDAPALTNSAEARILAELSDYVLMVVPRGKVTQQQIKKSREAVDRDKLIGFIFNN